MIGNFDEYAQGLWDFVRCVRPDGTAYASSGKCRKGTEEAKGEKTNKDEGSLVKPQIGGDLVGSTDLITGGLPRRKIEERERKWMRVAVILNLLFGAVFLSFAV